MPVLRGFNITTRVAGFLACLDCVAGNRSSFFFLAGLLGLLRLPACFSITAVGGELSKILLKDNAWTLGESSLIEFTKGFLKYGYPREFQLFNCKDSRHIALVKSILKQIEVLKIVLKMMLKYSSYKEFLKKVQRALRDNYQRDWLANF